MDNHSEASLPTSEALSQLKRPVQLGYKLMPECQHNDELQLPKKKGLGINQQCRVYYRVGT